MTRRKGKPKAKTKQIINSRLDTTPMSKFIEAEDSWEEGSRKATFKKAKLSKSGRSTSKASLRKIGRPLISISTDPAVGESASVINSFFPSGWQRCNDTLTSCKEQLNDQLATGPDRATSAVGQSVSGTCNDDVNYDLNRVTNVERNFVGLVRYNRLQYLYTGALIYSVINSVFLLQFLLYASDNAQLEIYDAPATNGMIRPTQVRETTSEDQRSTRAVQLDSSTVWQLSSSFAITNEDNDGNISGDIMRHKTKLSKEKSCASVLLLILMPLSLLMLVIILLNLIEFNSTDWYSLKQSTNSRINVFLEPFGSLLALVLISWPAYIQQLIELQLIGLTRIWPNEKENDCNASCRPISSIMIILYIISSLLESSSFMTKMLCAIWIAPALILQLNWVVVDSIINNYDHRPAMLMLIALFAGLFRRYLIVNAKNETFVGSSELIEAKVSLEQQRQQQETLLLSVLPAYVAEQVKRNMVKKMTSIDVGDLPIQNDMQQPTQAVTLVVTANSSNQRVSTQPAGTQSMASNNSTSNEEPTTKRNSLVKVYKSSTSHLTEVIVSGTWAALKPSSQEKISSPSFYPTSNFTQPPSQARRGFNELYIRTYNNVSLLYGDIVGFTRLCTQLSSSQLVRVLNDLFSHFDHLAEQHKIMRIKILGDCYYGVSGIPEFAVLGTKRTGSQPHSSQRASSSCANNHAINCVNMGLNMIQYIRCLNVEHASVRSAEVQLSNSSQSLRAGTTLSHSASVVNCCKYQNDNCSGRFAPQHAKSVQSVRQCQTPTILPPFELNMRIGIHTGHIHSGVIGLKKWQFDVWSNDVSIAMHCESSGVAGRVQVTEATVQHLHGKFSYEPAPRSQRDSYLADKDIRTFLIRERKAKPAAPEANSLQSPDQLNECTKPKWTKNKYDLSTTAMDEDKIRAATIGTIKQILLAGETANSCSLNAYALALDHQDLEPLGLRFRDQFQEKMFSKRQISLASIILSLLLVFLLAFFLPSGHFDLYRFGAQFADKREMLTCVGLCMLLILVAAISPLRCKVIRQLKSLTSERAFKMRRSDSGNRLAAGSHDKSNSRDAIKKKAQSQTGWMMRNLVELKKRAQKVWRLFRQSKLKNANSNWRSLSIVMVLLLVILGQFYLAITNICIHLTSNIFWASIESLMQQQVVVIIFTIAIDLISSNLLNFKWKSTLVLASALLHLIWLIRVSSGTHWLATQQQQDNSVGGLLKQSCKKLFELVESANMMPGTINSTTDSYHQAKQVDDTGGKLWLVLLWSNSLLTLVLAFWSLSFARQIEYSLRCNFLWRNRLNVDHEELEYISGINKVLLENILPSHVVHHYLTQQPVANAPHTSQPMERSETSDGYQYHRMVRMSISQMRSLNSNQLVSGCELYHEQHDSVAVMFASIPHFYEFYDESDISKQGLGCIALLNEIICDFDKLLLKNKFSRIEKIKTIGSTYMAAAGLRPLRSACSNTNLNRTNGGRNSITSQSSSYSTPLLVARHNNQAGNFLEAVQNLAPDSLSESSQADQRRLTLSQQKMNLICMIQFATSLMTTLNGINKQSFQVFKLRVGVNAGPVIAGIIGAQRPFYDIWGDCVNIASRMESLGEIGRIQVEEKTAKLLMECLCTDTYSIERRGPIDVKGKGGMVTYFVDKRQQSSANVPNTQNSDNRTHSLSNGAISDASTGDCNATEK